MKNHKVVDAANRKARMINVEYSMHGFFASIDGSDLTLVVDLSGDKLDIFVSTKEGVDTRIGEIALEK